MSRSRTAATVSERLQQLLEQFRLTTAAPQMVPRLLQSNQDDAMPIVLEVLELEAEARLQRRLERLRRASKLPPGKRFDDFDQDRLPPALRRQIAGLRTGEFLDEAINVLAFGLPGTGKTHALCALGHELLGAGRSVMFVSTYALVQQLLVAKRDLELPRVLRKLDSFDLLILDDIGYLEHTTEEAEVLFTLLAERYERRSVALTSNLMFSQWDRVFKNKMATTAAIDRLVHHSVVLEFDTSSYRTARAKRRKNTK